MERNGRKQYTLSDIARELGVNKATVSKAISGKGNLSAQTRQRILEFIEECGYRPNAVAQSLARSRTYNIGLMMPGQVGDVDSAFFRECLNGVCQVASDRQYDVLMALDQETTTHHIARLIDNRKIDGIIAMRSLVHSPVVGFLKEKQVPFVLIGPTSDPEALHIDNDNRNACRELTALLISQGVTKMALIGGDENNCVTRSRLLGFWDACGQAGLPEEAQGIFLNVAEEGRLAQAVQEAISQGADCIVCMDDYLCSLTMAHLRSLGVPVPQKVKVASFYDSVLLKNNIPPVTSLHFDAVELGRRACRMLIDRLEQQPEQDYAPPAYEILQRASTK
mgnify:CR=1 FL=1